MASPSSENNNGQIFLGKDEATYGKEGTGWVKYDPDYECGGKEGTPDRQCPFVLQHDNNTRERLLHIGIASYRDPLCPKTLFNLFSKAANPEIIRVRVLQQNDPSLDPDCLEAYCKLMKKQNSENKECPYKDQVFIHQVHASEAKGPTWARSILSHDIGNAHAKGHMHTQDYCMSMDSHMDFEPHWDASVVDMWKLTQNEYGVLSTYVASTDQLGVNLNGVHQVPHLCMVKFTEQVRTHATKCANNLVKPKLTNAIYGAGLVFSKCHAELKIPVDPHTPYVFDGEEFNRAARMWTYGYDIYTPHRVYVLHDYVNSQHNPITASWQRKHDSTSHHDALYRMNTLLEIPGGEGNQEKALALQQSRFGLGDRRSLDQLIQFSGIDLRHAKPSIDGKNRCGNLKWVPFQEHPKGVDFLPKFDAETEQPIDYSYDSTSVWHDRIARAEAPTPLSDARRDAATLDATKSNTTSTTTKTSATTAAIAAEAAGVDLDKPPQEDMEDQHNELHKLVSEAEEQFFKAAEPLLSGAEAHAMNIESLGGDFSKLRGKVVMAEHKVVDGFTALPLMVQVCVCILALGMVVAITLTNNKKQRKRRVKKRSA